MIVNENDIENTMKRIVEVEVERSAFSMEFEAAYLTRLGKSFVGACVSVDGEKKE